MPSFLYLFLLAAIWGGSFLFMRLAAPVLGAIWVAELRLALAAIFLAGVGLFIGRRLQARRYWQHYLCLGLFNSALPFLLFAYAAQTLSASLLAILNATAPLWGAAIGAASGRQPLTVRLALGLASGMAGVGILVGLGETAADSHTLPAVIAVLAATFSYGIASHYAANAPAVDAFTNAHGSMWASAIMLLPLALLFPLSEVPEPPILAAMAALGIVCSGIAYILYFRLIAELGATSALSVTFLIPVFGVLWGYLFLDEAVGWHTLFGGATVVAGTMLVTGYSLRRTRSTATTTTG